VLKKRPTLGGSLRQVRPLMFAPGRVVLGVETTFDEQQLSGADVIKFLEAEATAQLGEPTTVEVRRSPSDLEERPATLTENEDQERAQRRADKSAAARASSAVQQVKDLLGGTIARVKVADED